MRPLELLIVSPEEKTDDVVGGQDDLIGQLISDGSPLVGLEGFLCPDSTRPDDGVGEFISQGARCLTESTMQKSVRISSGYKLFAAVLDTAKQALTQSVRRAESL